MLLSCIWLCLYCSGQFTVLVPVLIMRQSMEDVQKVARRLKTEDLDLLKYCLPKVIIHILPRFANSNQTDRDSQRQHAQATKVYDMLIEMVQKEVGRM